MKKTLQSLLIAAALVCSANASESENFGGLGMSVWTSKNGVKIAGVLPGSPAEGIGLQEGDLILSANGTDFSTTPPEMQISYIRGEAGTSISLVVEREGNKITLSTKRVALSVQNLEAGDISAWYGKSNGLTEEEISFLASQKSGEGYKLLGVMQYGRPITKSAENLNTNAMQHISMKEVAEAVPQPEAEVQSESLNSKLAEAPLVNAKGVKVKKKGKNMPVYRKLK